MRCRLRFGHSPLGRQRADSGHWAEARRGRGRFLALVPALPDPAKRNRPRMARRRAAGRLLLCAVRSLHTQRHCAALLGSLSTQYGALTLSSPIILLLLLLPTLDNRSANLGPRVSSRLLFSRPSYLVPFPSITSLPFRLSFPPTSPHHHIFSPASSPQHHHA